MQNATGDTAEQVSDDRNDAYRAVVCDLVSLIEHVQACLRLIERAIAEETSAGSLESSANVVVLDDVSPRYMSATAALHACDASLGLALHSLQDPGDTDSRAIGPEFSIVRA